MMQPNDYTGPIIQESDEERQQRIASQMAADFSSSPTIVTDTSTSPAPAAAASSNESQPPVLPVQPVPPVLQQQQVPAQSQLPAQTPSMPVPTGLPQTMSPPYTGVAPFGAQLNPTTPLFIPGFGDPQPSAQAQMAMGMPVGFGVSMGFQGLNPQAPAYQPPQMGVQGATSPSSAPGISEAAKSAASSVVDDKEKA